MGESLGDQIAARLLDEIIDGRYPPGTPLPPEWELADREGASRLTIREAVRILRQKNVVTVVRGRGTFVQPRQSWSPLDPAVLGALARSPDALTERLQALLEARALVEVGVAELAAARRDERDLAAMVAALEAMREAEDDLDAFVAADLSFHDAVMGAAGNPVVAALFDPIALLLRDTRRRTSRDPVARGHAVRAHERILAAIERRDPVQAAGAMRDHLTETGEDFAARRASLPARRSRRRAA
jgi:GntR family transcriptional repressor for pyruvate dehydrogenase complex